MLCISGIAIIMIYIISYIIIEIIIILCWIKIRLHEPHHDKTNIVRLCIHAAWSGSMLFAYQLYYKWKNWCATGLDPCWLQMHYDGFVVTRLTYILKVDSTLKPAMIAHYFNYLSHNIIFLLYQLYLNAF
jgi:hypothetical protein